MVQNKQGTNICSIQVQLVISVIFVISLHYIFNVTLNIVVVFPFFLFNHSIILLLSVILVIRQKQKRIKYNANIQQTSHVGQGKRGKTKYGMDSHYLNAHEYFYSRPFLSVSFG